MKKATLYAKVLATGLFVSLFSNACTDLDENLYDSIRQDDFLKTEEEFIAALGSAYTTLYGIGNHGSYFSVQEVSSDEIMIPQRGGDWGDGGQWLNVHRHEYKPTDPNINNAWNFLFGGVATCNRLIFQFDELKAAGKADPVLADKFIAELRALRALYYYWLLDSFGNVPVVSDFKDTSKPATKTRAEVYAFVESELNATEALLDKKNDGTTYGRMTAYVVNAIQAKLYLNAGVYKGSPEWAKCVTACDKVINSGLFRVEGNYRANFITNNQNSKEIILAVPYDQVFAQGFNLAQMTLHYGSQATFDLQAQPWNGYCSLQEFYESHDATDTRRINFVVGPQFASDGVTPILDAGAEANDPDGAQLNFTPQINEHFPNALRQAGVRVGKYEFAKGATPNLSNDFMLLRYADILLAKAEALYRQDAGSADALALVNVIRNRAGQPAFASLNDDDLLAERGREMFYEGVRRQDLIRFGKFLPGYNAWTPAATDAGKILWPIPTSQINANSSLAQNPGY
jgi:starch-binding outer membrane protein, SusD/RagB family